MKKIQKHCSPKEEQNNSTSVCTEQCHINPREFLHVQIISTAKKVSLPYMVIRLTTKKGKITAELLTSDLERNQKKTGRKKKAVSNS